MHGGPGIRIFCTEERSQLKNKEKALALLRSRLFDLELEQQRAEIAARRKSQVCSSSESYPRCPFVPLNDRRICSKWGSWRTCKMAKVVRHLPLYPGGLDLTLRTCIVQPPHVAQIAVPREGNGNSYTCSRSWGQLRAIMYRYGGLKLEEGFQYACSSVNYPDAEFGLASIIILACVDGSVCLLSAANLCSVPIQRHRSEACAGLSCSHLRRWKRWLNWYESRWALDRVLRRLRRITTKIVVCQTTEQRSTLTWRRCVQLCGPCISCCCVTMLK